MLDVSSLKIVGHPLSQLAHLLIYLCPPSQQAEFPRNAEAFGQVARTERKVAGSKHYEQKRIVRKITRQQPVGDHAHTNREHSIHNQLLGLHFPRSLPSLVAGLVNSITEANGVPLPIFVGKVIEDVLLDLFEELKLVFGHQ